jgi:hypothetical protein
MIFDAAEVVFQMHRELQSASETKYKGLPSHPRPTGSKSSDQREGDRVTKSPA